MRKQLRPISSPSLLPQLAVIWLSLSTLFLYTQCSSTPQNKEKHSESSQQEAPTSDASRPESSTETRNKDQSAVEQRLTDNTKPDQPSPDDVKEEQTFSEKKSLPEPTIDTTQPEPTIEKPPLDKGGTRRTLHVGPTRKLKRPSDAAKIVRNGDIVEIDAGLYKGDVAIWRANGLIIRGIGGKAHLQANGRSAERKAIWVIKGNNTTVESIEFSGAVVRDRNGAGIRQEGDNLTIRHCFFHDNQNGILAGSKPKSTIIIEYSVFSRNGHGRGQTHNMYINGIKHFILRYSYTHHTKVGHNVKTRAARSDILYNRITDEKDGRSSYSIDFSNGGLVYVIGNIIQQSPQTQNSSLVSYGAEGQRWPKNELYFVNNTVINNRHTGVFVNVRLRNPQKVMIRNNLFVGKGNFTQKTGWDIQNNLLTAQDPGFANASRFDYHLKTNSKATNLGKDPGSVNGIRLLPLFHYKHTASRATRKNKGALDLGAFEGP